MAEKRIILELGSGTDLHGGDYTKAARRAVEDAIRHSSLTFVKTLNVPPAGLIVRVTIGVQKPDLVDAAEVAKLLPHGEVSVAVQKGGLDVPDDALGDIAVIASAAVAVYADLS